MGWGGESLKHTWTASEPHPPALMQTGCSHPSSSPACQPSLPFRSGFRVEETFPGSWLNPLIWKESLVGRRLSGSSAGRCPVASASQVGMTGLESWHLQAWGLVCF